MKKNSLLIVAVMCVASLATAGAADIHVAPNGDDGNPGTADKPLATLVSARDMAKSGDSIVLHQGTYLLADTLTLEPRHSGVAWKAAPGARPVITGGIMVTGWTKHENGIYKAHLNRNVKLRTLYVNGERAFMARRTSNALGGSGTYSVVAGQAPWAWDNGTKADGVQYRAADFPAVAANRDDIEIESRSTWNTYIVCTRDIITNKDKRIALLQQPGGAIAQSGGWGACFNATGSHEVRNAYELLGTPGEFFFDKQAQTLYYYPRPGEQMAVSTVIAPTAVETLFRLRGDSTSSRVSGITVQGVTFECTDWNLVNVGGSAFKGAVQAATSFTAFSNGNPHPTIYRAMDLHPAAICAENVDGFRFEDCIVRHTGCEGISLVNDVINTKLTGNVFSDIAGAAIVVGHPQHTYIGDGGAHEKYPPGREGVCANITVDNNLVANPAVLFAGHPAVNVYYADTFAFTHNTIVNSPYNAISMGWGWGEYDGSAKSKFPGKPSTIARNNRIGANSFINSMCVLNDGGPIYTLGAQPGSRIADNHIKGVPAGHRYGIHNDEGSAFMTIASNVIDTNTKAACAISVGTWGRQHNLTYSNNYATMSSYWDTNVPNSTVPPLKAYGDAVWPMEAYRITCQAGLERAYLGLISAQVVCIADQIFPASVFVAAGSHADLPVRPVAVARGSLWLAPKATTGFKPGPGMTRADGGAALIPLPAAPGTYNLFVLDDQGRIVAVSQSICRIDTP